MSRLDGYFRRMLRFERPLAIIVNRSGFGWLSIGLASGLLIAIRL
jgi:hypothetical protein